MKVKVKKGETEVIIDPEDRDIISAANKILEDLNDDKKELIESIIEQNLLHFDVTNPNPEIPTSIGKSFEILLSPQAATVLINLISNPKHIKITLDKLKSEDLIGETASEFIVELTAKYGVALHTLLLNIERSNEWIRINSGGVISESMLKLQSKIWRADGEVFQFTSSIEDSIILVEHILRRTLELIKTVDKERILELDNARILELEKRVAEIKELHESVKKEIDEIEHSKENALTTE